MEEKVEIKIDPRNYRIHGDENKRLIHKSLVECRAGRSVLADRDNVLIAGNGVYEEAQKLGLKVRIVESDGTELIVIKRKDLSTEDEKRKLLALADNHTSDTSRFNFSAIVDDFNLDMLGEWNLNIPNFNIDEDKLDDFFSGSTQPASKKEKVLICPFCGRNVYEKEDDDE